MISWFSKNFTRSSNSKGETEQFYYGWIVVATLLVIGVIGFGISFSFGVFFTPLLEDFGSTRALISGIFSVYIVLGPVFAIFGKRSGSKDIYSDDNVNGGVQRNVVFASFLR